MKRNLTLLTLLAFIAIFTSCERHPRKHTVKQAPIENVVVPTEISTPEPAEISPMERFQIESMLAKYIKARGITTFANELYDTDLKHYKPANYQEFMDIAEALWTSEEYLDGTIYYSEAYIKDKEYCLALFAMIKTEKQERILHAQKVLSLQQADYKRYIEMYEGFVTMLEARKILAESGVTYGTLEEFLEKTGDYKSLKDAGITVGEGQIHFESCGIGIDTKDALKLSLVKMHLKDNKESLKYCQKFYDAIQAEMSELLIKKETTLLSTISTVLKNGTPEAQKKTKAVIKQNRITY